MWSWWSSAGSCAPTKARLNGGRNWPRWNAIMSVSAGWRPGDNLVEKRLEEALRKAVALLESHGYRYALVGGVALSQWGVVRATYDVDIKVLVPDMDYSAVRAALLAPFPQRAREHLPRESLVIAVEIEGVTVDFLLALPGYEELIIQRAVQRDMGGWTAWICSAEDLIIQKVIAGRPRDWSDVEALLIEQRGRIDEAYIEEWLEQFVEALEKPELLTDYQRLLERIRSLDTDDR